MIFEEKEMVDEAREASATTPSATIITKHIHSRCGILEREKKPG